MADIADRAGEWEQMQRDAALARHARVAQAAQTNNSGCTHCQDCGEPISQQRLHALPHAIRCIDCARRCELRDRLAGYRTFP